MESNRYFVRVAAYSGDGISLLMEQGIDSAYPVGALSTLLIELMDEYGPEAQYESSIISIGGDV